jgi:protocatechuate 3,4-dioxygenase beta subunit
MSWVRRRSRALAILAMAGTMAAVGGAFAGVSSAAGREPGGGSETGCPASTSPNAMTLVAGTPQTAMLQSAYATGLQVALTNTDGCAVTSDAAGVAVTFTAPSSGAGGVFSASGTNTVTVGADSSGMVSAPTFTANAIAGSFTVTASSQYGTVTFALTNTATGTPARLVAVSPAKQAATVTHGYRQALAVRVLDGDGAPVAGASVTFTLTTATASSACGSSSDSGENGTGSSADASFAGGASEASATSDAAGVATSPALTAGGEAGTFTASAALGSSSSSEPHAGSGASSGVTPMLFTLANDAGAPAKLVPGVGETQSARVGARFPVSLAVTITDAEGNRVPGALVSFAAPATGPSGRFTVRVASHSRRTRHAQPARTRQTRVASVRTNACGVAVAPTLTADAQPGGYVVKASAGRARAAAFALVNEAR